MQFDPEEGIANLDPHLDMLKDAADAQGFKFDRHAARNELQAATFGKRRPAIARLLLSPDRRDGDRGEGGATRPRAGSAAAGRRRARAPRRSLPTERRISG